jgi:hypothetical protein
MKKIGNILYIMFTLLAIGFIVYANVATKKVDTTEKPYSQDSIIDNMDMWCGDTISDEYRMWIGENGDTIWE